MSADPLGTIVSAWFGSESSDNAAQAQVQAAQTSSDSYLAASRESNALQEKMYNQGREDTAPWRTTGKNALLALEQQINAGPGDYTQSPGYQFRLSEGQKALERSAAARGGLIGGASQKALLKYGQDYATSDYDNFLRRYYEKMTPLQSLAGVGQSTAAQTAASGANMANSIANTNMNTAAGVGQNYLNAGNAAAGNYINQANVITGAMRANSSAMNSGFNNYLNWKNQFGGGSGGSGNWGGSGPGAGYQIGEVGSAYTPSEQAYIETGSWG